MIGRCLAKQLGIGRRVTTLGAAGILFATVMGAAAAVTVTEEAKLTASDGATRDNFGYSVAINGDTAVVGANLTDDDGEFSGSAYLFSQSADGWVETAKLTASDASAGDALGSSVAVAGDIVLIGATGDDDNAPHSGSAYVFSRSGDSWLETAKLTASDAAAGDYFGYSVAMLDGTLLVGAPFDDVDGVGSVYVFTRNGDTWIESAKLAASDSLGGEQFGISVAAERDTVVVGASGDSGYMGAAHVFTRSGDDWIETAKLTASDGAPSDLFGGAVAVSGDTVVVGSESGKSYIFILSGDNWVQTAVLEPSDPAVGNSFGGAVAVSNGIVLVGAPHEYNGQGPGSVYAFSRSGDDWAETGKLAASDGAAGDVFGFRVALSGDVAVVSALWDDASGLRSGSAYVFATSELGGAPPCSILGTPGDDVLVGTMADDVICGLGGDDIIRGRGGDDILIAGAGNDTLKGNTGDDELHGDEGTDRLFGGPGADTLRGGADGDWLTGGRGIDALFGEAGEDTLIGGPGPDSLSGGEGSDILWGGPGPDSLSGGEGSDILWGGPAGDLIEGGFGDDQLFGGPGIDTLDGGDGNDTCTDEGITTPC
jgi:Ca2+-binding RTX toxin-like protein